MEDFMKIANDVSIKIETMANIIQEDENLQEYLYESEIEGMTDALNDCNYILASWLYLESFLF